MATEVLQITLPTNIAERLHSLVRSGEYATESEVIIDLLDEGHELDLSPAEIDEALRLGYEALMELHVHPESAVTMEQMRADLAEQHRRSTTNA